MKIYRYRPLSHELSLREFDALENAYLYAPNFDQLNDTMEGKYELDPLENLALDAYLQNLGGSVSVLNDQIKTMMNNFGVISLSTSHPQKQRNMWAHYANNYKGFCIEFDKKNLAIGDLFQMNYVRVHYSNKRQDPLKIATILDMKLEPVIKMLSTKTTEWQAENEVRYLTGATGKHYYIDDAISKIYLGLKIEEEFKNEILRIFKNRNVSILQGRSENGPIKFDVIQEPCDTSKQDIIGAKSIDFQSYIYDETSLREFLDVPYSEFEKLCKSIASSPNILDDWSIGIAKEPKELFLHVQYRLRNGAERNIPRFFDSKLTLVPQNTRNNWTDST